MRVRRPDAAAALAAFRERAKGLRGPELEAEITKLLEELVASNLEAVPRAHRKQAREAIYGALTHDPTLQAMLADLRAGAKREL